MANLMTVSAERVAVQLTGLPAGELRDKYERRLRRLSEREAQLTDRQTDFDAVAQLDTEFDRHRLGWSGWPAGAMPRPPKRFRQLIRRCRKSCSSSWSAIRAGGSGSTTTACAKTVSPSTTSGFGASISTRSCNCPSAANLDSQSVKNTATSTAHVGYDAGKRLKGRKRFFLVDLQGNLLAAWVTSAAVHDARGTLAE